jgi:hydrophobic/amphiphilic exporter-1 (mainly G- bacteria), HAE1 family
MSSAGQGGGGITGGNVGRLVIRLAPRDTRPGADAVIDELRAATRKLSGVNVTLQNPASINVGALIVQQRLSADPDLERFRGAQGASAAVEKRLDEVPQMLRTSTATWNCAIPNCAWPRPGAGGAPGHQRAAGAAGAVRRARRAPHQRNLRRRRPVHGQPQGLPEAQLNPAIIGQLPLRTASGELTRLDAVATVEAGVGPIAVHHYGQQPAVTLSFNLAARRLARRGAGAALTTRPRKWCRPRWR